MVTGEIDGTAIVMIPLFLNPLFGSLGPIAFEYIIRPGNDSVTIANSLNLRIFHANILTAVKIGTLKNSPCVRWAQNSRCIFASSLSACEVISV